LKQILGGTGFGLVKVLFRHFSGETKEKKEAKTSVLIGSVSAEIRTEAPHQNYVERYRYANPLSGRYRTEIASIYVN
jgi:hypothetical protein